jgi:hypothetical protein
METAMKANNRTPIRKIRLSRSLALLLVAAIMVYASPSAVRADGIENGNFEAEDLTGWQVDAGTEGSVDLVASAVNTQQSVVFTPVSGNQFALLRPGAPGQYTSLFQSFQANAGQAISCWSFFVSGDTEYGDAAEVRIRAGGNVIATVFGADAPGVGDLGYKPWTQWQYTFQSAGTYEIEARVINANDNLMPSLLGLDRCQVGDPASFPPYRRPPYHPIPPKS